MGYIEWLRSRVGQRKILLTFASLIVRDEAGRVLLQRRNDFDAWGLPGGVLEIGESILACARRELVEESGLVADELGLVGLYSEPIYDTRYPNGDRAQQYTLCFQTKVAGGRLHADGVESRALAFFETDSLPLPEILPWYRAMLNDALIQDAAGSREPAFGQPVIDILPLPQIAFMRRFVGDAAFIAAGAIAVIVNQDFSVLMVQHKPGGKWSLPGSYLHIGENAAHAAQRAALKETGLQVSVQRILGIHSPDAPWLYPGIVALQPIITLFLCRKSDNDAPPDSQPPFQTAWVPRDRVSTLEVNPSQVGLHQAVADHLHGGYFIL